MKRIIPVIAALVVTAAIASSLSSCSAFQSKVTDMRGSIIGNTFTIDTFDNFGNLTLKVHGTNIDITPNVVKEITYTSGSGSGFGYVETLSSQITITIDGNEMKSCGDTCIFYDDSLAPIYDFSVSNIDSSSDGSLGDTTFVAKNVNQIKNLIGKKCVIVIKSQTGKLIYAFEGDSVYEEVPENLPKFTKISIDGKPLYIHRANYQIIDSELIGEN